MNDHCRVIDKRVTVLNRNKLGLPIVVFLSISVSQHSKNWTKIDVKKLGMVVVSLGGGRRQQDDKLDLSVGLDQFLPLGEKVSVGSVLARVHGRDGVKAIFGPGTNIPAAASEILKLIVQSR